MKYLIYIALFFSLNTAAQLQWRPIVSAFSNPNGQRFDDVFFISDTVGWALNGGYASVYKTTNGGATWTQQLNESDLGGGHYFRNIEFLTPNIGFIGTLSDNSFYKTIDGGTTWTLVTGFSTNPAAVCGLDAVGTTTVYGCGAYFGPAFIIKSTDSGTTWQYIDMSAHANALVEILFLTENIGYAAGKNATGGVVLKTTNGGTTWTQVYNTTIAGEYVWKLQTLSSNSDIIFGSVESISPLTGKFIKSNNAGATWVSKPAPDTDIQAVGFITENKGWMGGHNTGFYETIDSGDTWTNLNIGSNLNRIFIINSGLAYASGTTIYKFDTGSLANENFDEQNRKLLNATVNPNPITDKLNLTIDFNHSDNLVIELYDQLGRRIKELLVDKIDQSSQKKYTFDFPYPNGIYFINLHNNTGRQSIKVVK